MLLVWLVIVSPPRRVRLRRFARIPVVAGEKGGETPFPGKSIGRGGVGNGRGCPRGRTPGSVNADGPDRHHYYSGYVTHRLRVDPESRDATHEH